MVLLTPQGDPSLLEALVNAMRVGLHPKGLAPWIINLPEVRSYFIERLEPQVALSRDPSLCALFQDVASYPRTGYTPEPNDVGSHHISPQLQLRLHNGGQLSFFATVLTFGTAVDVTASELSIELGFPADAATAEMLTRVVGDLISRTRASAHLVDQ
jgi:MmyB-like transcription regulator ligand binding domain